MSPNPGTPAPTTETPQPTTEFNPNFSYRDLDLMEVTTMDNYKYLLFMVNGEYCVYIRRGEYMEYLSFIFDRIEELQAAEANCWCDTVFPDFREVDERIPIMFYTDKGEEERDIPIYECYNLLSNLTLGKSCTTKNNEDGTNS